MFGKKTYRTVVMDGTNDYVVGRISGIQSAIAKSKVHFAHVTYPNGSSIMILPVKASRLQYSRIKRTIETRYPGLCIFDPEIVLY